MERTTNKSGDAIPAARLPEMFSSPVWSVVPTDPVLDDRRLSDHDPQHYQLTVDARRAQSELAEAHLAESICVSPYSQVCAPIATANASRSESLADATGRWWLASPGPLGRDNAVQFAEAKCQRWKVSIRTLAPIPTLLCNGQYQRPRRRTAGAVHGEERVRFSGAG